MFTFDKVEKKGLTEKQVELLDQLKERHELVLKEFLCGHSTCSETNRILVDPVFGVDENYAVCRHHLSNDECTEFMQKSGLHSLIFDLRCCGLKLKYQLALEHREKCPNNELWCPNKC